MEYLLAFILVFLVRSGGSESARNSKKNPATASLNLDVTSSTSKRTVQRYNSAMDQIMAVNRHRHIKHLDEIPAKKMNISGKNESADEEIIQVNKGQKTSDDLFEGDVSLDPMVPDDFQLIKLKDENKDGLAETSIRKRQATRQMKRLWLNRRVPYQISGELDGSVRSVIEQSIVKFNTKSCVKFVPRRGNERDYVIFKKNDGCYSRIGRSYVAAGYQVISIGTGCDVEGIILHEMLHCVGFYHEQSRPDRNRFLEIIWENIQPNLEAQFLQYGHGEIDRFGIGYNYKSIMHYGRTAFTVASDRHTMEAIGDPNLELGNTDMTPDDVLELDALYDCKTTTYNSWTSWSSFGPCDSYCYKRRQRYCYGSSPKACGGNPNDYGIENQDIKCNANECPIRIDGHWGRWSPWGYCSVNCNEGVQSRKRTCDDPTPANGGVACPNSKNDYRICREPRCTLGDYDADFRNGLIGSVWRNDADDTPGFDWLIGQWGTRTENTGPPKDHSSGTGYYLYVESSGRAVKDNACLISFEIPPATGENKKCMKFFYHMYGSTTGSLSLVMYPVSQQPISLFWKSGNQGNKWIPAKVTLSSSVKFQLVFEAIALGASYSDIAIDDVFIDDGDCDCQDEYRSCSIWSKKGDCANSYMFMTKNCARACNVCGCRDKNERCATWGMEQCRQNPLYMHVECPLTCHVCSCHDDNIRCARWAKSGECKNNYSYMNKHCRKSCGLCT